tara:strand:- start:581 stop:892 length:312 start_codon:yes stop_codon:yes gene_type:complete
MKFTLAVTFLAAAAQAADQVEVLLCVEAYCPGCQQFTMEDLAPTYMLDGMSDIMNLTFVPFGKFSISGYEVLGLFFAHPSLTPPFQIKSFQEMHTSPTRLPAP